jgi:hypothetical protein
MKVQTLDTQSFFARLGAELDAGPALGLEKARQIKDTLAALSPAQLRKVSLPLLEDLGIAKELQPHILFQVLALRVPSFDPALAAKSSSDALNKLLEIPQGQVVYRSKYDTSEYHQRLHADEDEAVDRIARELQTGARLEDLAPAKELTQGFSGPDPTGPFRELGKLTDPVAKWTGSFSWMEISNRDGADPRIKFIDNDYQKSWQLETGHGTRYSTSLDYATAERLDQVIGALLGDPARTDEKAKVALEGMQKSVRARLEELRGTWGKELSELKSTLSKIEHGFGQVASKQALDDVIEGLARNASMKSVLQDPVLEKGGYYPGRRLDIHSASDPKNEEKSITIFRDGDSFQLCLGKGLKYRSIFRSNDSPEHLDIDTARSLLGTVQKLIASEKPPADPTLRAALEGRQKTLDYDALVALETKLEARIDSLSGYGAALQALEGIVAGAKLDSKNWNTQRALLKKIAADPAISAALEKSGDRIQIGSSSVVNDSGAFSLDLFLTGRGLEVGGYFMGPERISWRDGFISGRSQSGGPIAPKPAVFEDGEFVPNKLKKSVWGEISLADVTNAIRAGLARGVPE